MRNLNKTLRTAKIDGKPWKEAIFDFLLHYRIHHITPHSLARLEALYRKIRCKIPTYEEVKENELTKRDKLSKEKSKTYFDKRFGARVSCIKVGDFVLVKQPKINKLTSKFDPKPYQIITIKGQCIVLLPAPNHQHEMYNTSSSYPRHCR